jgi:hypothetical protein
MSRTMETTNHARGKAMMGCRAYVTLVVTLVSLTLPAWIAVAEEAKIDNRNSVELFLGNTQAGSTNGATIGITYERRFTRLLGAGGFVEYTGGDFDNSAVGADIVFHPHAGWVFKLSPGAEFESGEASALFRIGAAYDFEVAPNWFLSPEVNVKLLEGEKEVIYGLSIGHDF